MPHTFFEHRPPPLTHLYKLGNRYTECCGQLKDELPMTDLFTLTTIRVTCPGTPHGTIADAVAAGYVVSSTEPVEPPEVWGIKEFQPQMSGRWTGEFFVSMAKAHTHATKVNKAKIDAINREAEKRVEAHNAAALEDAYLRDAGSRTGGVPMRQRMFVPITVLPDLYSYVAAVQVEFSDGVL